MKIAKHPSPIQQASLNKIAGKNLLIQNKGHEGQFKIYEIVTPTAFQPLALIDRTAMIALAIDLAVFGRGNSAIAEVPVDDFPETVVNQRLRRYGVIANIATLPEGGI